MKIEGKKQKQKRREGKTVSHPEAKTPVARRMIKGSTAESSSLFLSGLILKGLGSGGLKFGGGENDSDVEVVSVSPETALMQIRVLCSLFVGNEIGLWSENCERVRVPDPAMAMTLGKLLLESKDEVKSEECDNICV